MHAKNIFVAKYGYINFDTEYDHSNSKPNRFGLMRGGQPSPNVPTRQQALQALYHPDVATATTAARCSHVRKSDLVAYLARPDAHPAVKGAITDRLLHNTEFPPEDDK